MSKEIILSKDTMIVSETDLKGNITYANNDFCTIAGYTKEELIGKPQNILRHYDMPKSAFADLWQTIKQSKTWNGIVKNISRNGDYYWVNATVYGVDKKDGKRFVSVRIKPTQEEINSATKLYKNLLNEERK